MAEGLERRVIIVAMDGSKEADHALEFYMKNIYKECDDVIVIHCIHHVPYHTIEAVWMPIDANTLVRAIEEDIARGTEICDKLKHLLEMYKKGGRVSVMKLHGGDPGQLIVQKAKECGASAIIVGSRGMGKIRRTIMGSVSDYILHHADVPVLICH